ncbi:MAG: hypothetical protein QNK05_16255 [Myxococcota bacterium]|nr:hypothetical protein [Myxococcota bacterium]
MQPGLPWLPFGLRVALAIAALGGCVLRGRARSAAWFAVAGALVVGLALAPLAAPNHHFLLAYAALAVALSGLLPEPARTHALSESSRWLLFGVMLFATLQKALADPYLDGSFFHFLLLHGGLGNGWIEPLVPGLAEAVAANTTALGTFLATQPSEGVATALVDPGPRVALLARGLAWLGLAVEAGLAIGLGLAPRSTGTRGLLLAFAFGVFALRQEDVFLASVCALGAATCAPRSPGWHRALAASTLCLLALGALGLRAPA